MLHVVIMAGGAGTRLWPESRRLRPKQLLPLRTQRTLIEETVARNAALAPPERMFIATGGDLSEPITNVLGRDSGIRQLIEPCRRNTAPCIGLAAIHASHEDPEATMLVVPSDQVVDPDEAFHDAVRCAASLVEEDPTRLVTFGIRPTYPSTGFGYIERGHELEGLGESSQRAYQVKRFHEKPDAEKATAYCRSGKFYWNAGMFFWRAEHFLAVLAEHEPAMAESLEKIGQAIGTDAYQTTLEQEFESMASISVDYAVMERADNVVVVEAPFAWDDVGSWKAMERLHAADDNGNVLLGGRTVAVDVKGSIARTSDEKKVIALGGVEDLVVIDTPDALLIAPKNDEGMLRRLVDEMQERGWNDVL